MDKLRRYARRFPCRIYTRHINPARSLFRRVLKQHSCAPGTPDIDLLLQPEGNDLVFDKRGKYGLSPAQVAVLKRRRIRRITVCGLDTDACVLGVMFSLFDAGIPAALKASLCWSSSGLHRQALAIIDEQFHALR